MSNFETSAIRNIALISHVGTGKTSLAEAFLFNAEKNTRLGKVDDESSLLDFEPEEKNRRTTISSSIASFDYKNTRFNLIDTPGSKNFIADTRNCLEAADGVILVIDAIDGMKVQTSKLYRLLEELSIPFCLFINKLDRENANYKETFNKSQEYFNQQLVELQIPIGECDNYTGYIDLFSMKSITYDDADKIKVENIPDELSEIAELAREKALESIVECDDEILEKYLEGHELSNQDIAFALKQGILRKQIIPVLSGSATNNTSIKGLMEFCEQFLPSPTDITSKLTFNTEGQEHYVHPKAEEPFCALVFKTLSDPFTGQLSIMRICSGMLNSDSTIMNYENGAKERIGQIHHLMGKDHQPTQVGVPGDIVAVSKLKDTHTNDTLCSEKLPLKIPTMIQPSPVISYAIKPKSKGDEEKIQSSLKRLLLEDTALQISRDRQTNELILSGLGQVHLDVAIEKLKRKFSVAVLLQEPKIPYKETITTESKVQGKYKKQSGGKGQYGECWIEVQPSDNYDELEFVDKIIGGSIPRQYIPAVEQGVKEAMNEGIIAGYPVVGVKVILYDGSYHSVDSSEMAFKMAGSMAFKKAVEQCSPVLLEPLMQVEITVPEEYTGEITGDLNSKRGHMTGIDTEGQNRVIKSDIPMSEMLKYSVDLNSMTSGAGTFTMEFSHYEPIPQHLAQKIIDKAQKQKEIA